MSSLFRRTQGSRVHELARMDTTGLRALYIRIREHTGTRDKDLREAMAGWDRDRLITRIRDLEDPFRLAMQPPDELDEDDQVYQERHGNEPVNGGDEDGEDHQPARDVGC
jgi:hypothetical protein